MNPRWISDRSRAIELSGVRKVFELGRSLKNPVNLSIGQPHFAVPEPIKAAAKAAIDADQNGYTVTQGIAPLINDIQSWVDDKFAHHDRRVLITSGTSGGLLLAFCACVNPGDEVILFDPYFVGYPAFVTLAGGVPVIIDTAPDFRIDIDKVKAAITPRTKAILVSSPANPTGVVLDRDTARGLAQLAADKGILFISDEIYRRFCYDEPFVSPAEFNPDVLVVDGFGKTYGITGWRLGFAHGPHDLIEEMTKLQQFSYVCAPSIVQHAGRAAWQFDVSDIVADYKRKRDRITAGLRGHFEFTMPGGAFYVFPKVPHGTATEFVGEAIRRNLLIIPGNVFSLRDDHIRISYAAEDSVIDQGIEILNSIAKR